MNWSGACGKKFRRRKRGIRSGLIFVGFYCVSDRDADEYESERGGHDHDGFVLFGKSVLHDRHDHKSAQDNGKQKHGQSGMQKHIGFRTPPALFKGNG